MYDYIRCSFSFFLCNLHAAVFVDSSFFSVLCVFTLEIHVITMLTEHIKWFDI